MGTTRASTGKYAGYTVEVGEDIFSQQIWFEERPPFSVLRVHYVVTRTPSEKTFRVRHLSGSTEADRQKIEAQLADIPRLFDVFERGGATTRKRRDDGKHYVYTYAGTLVDDPLANLELEMMVDGSSSVPSARISS